MNSYDGVYVTKLRPKTLYKTKYERCVAQLILASVLVCASFSAASSMLIPGSFVELNENRNARESGSFKSDLQNLAFVAKKGLGGTILNVKKFSSGNYGLQISIEQGTDINGGKHQGEKIWIYYRAIPSPKAPQLGSSYLTIHDKSDHEIAKAEDVAPSHRVETKVDGVGAYQTATPLKHKPASPPAAVDSEGEAEVCESCAEARPLIDQPVQDTARLGHQIERSLPDPPPLARAKSGACFDPRTNPAVVTLQKRWKDESPESIAEINRFIMSHRSVIDPRLVYYRMMGESGGDPHIKNKQGSHAYGMFEIMHAKEIFQRLERENPTVSPRLLQVKYYINEYVKTGKQQQDTGHGRCGSKPFDELSSFEKAIYLGWGNCSAKSRQAEARLCVPSNASYFKSGACALRDQAGAGGPPLCGD